MLHEIRSDKSAYLRDYHDSSVSPRKNWKMPRIQWGKDDQVEYPDAPLVLAIMFRGD